MSPPLYDGGISDEEAQPRKKLDKGKGKMKVTPELPEDIWKVVFEMYYNDICEGESQFMVYPPTHPSSPPIPPSPSCPRLACRIDR